MALKPPPPLPERPSSDEDKTPRPPKPLMQPPIPSEATGTPEVAPKEKTQKKKRKVGFTRGVAGAVAAACGIAAGGIFYISQSVTSSVPTVVGYQLVDPLVANQPILRENTVPVQVPVDSAPVGMLTGEELGAQPHYARVDMPANQILTSVVAVTSTRTGTDIPADWQVLSFEVPAENAVAGRVSAGDFVNMFVVPPSAASQEDIGLAVPLFENLYILDARSGPGGDDPNADPATYGGIPTTYLVGLPADMAQLLIAAQAADVAMYLTLPTISADAPANPLDDNGEPRVSSYFDSLLDALRAVSTWEQAPAEATSGKGASDTATPTDTQADTNNSSGQ